MARAPIAGRTVMLAGIAVLLGLNACARAGFNPSTDGTGPGSEGAHVDGTRDGSSMESQVVVDGSPMPDGGTADQKPGDSGMRDGSSMDSRIVVDGSPVPDGRAADQKLGDNGVVPGTWVTIVKGLFTMGSPLDEPCRFSGEQQHVVTLTHGFEMQDTEVTQGQFLAMMGYNPSGASSCGTTCPVEQVSWHEAAAYCNALSRKANKTACYRCSGSGASVTCQEEAAYSGQKVYDCPGYRLPTEAEWEYAYRARTSTAYYGGVNDKAACGSCSKIDANADKIGWYCANSSSATHPVKGKQPNAWGLYDMAGNTWEWCHDWYSSLASSAVTDPWGSATGSERAVRGGSWFHSADLMRAAHRSSDTPTTRYADLGFRCCGTIP